MPADLAVVEELLDDWRDDHADGELRAMILGVTPELATLPWPAGTSLVAVDRSEDMIRALWPPAGLQVPASVHRADWLQLPSGDREFDLVTGDGCNILLPYPEGLSSLATEVARVLVPEGRFAMRVFVRPAERETVEAVADDVHAGRIESFHAFKWRLAMALQPSAAEGVPVADIWTAFTRICPDRRALRWSESTIATIDNYRDAPAVYAFPTLDELRAAMTPQFVETRCVTPDYELGECCPSLVLEPVGAGAV